MNEWRSHVVKLRAAAVNKQHKLKIKKKIFKSTDDGQMQ